MEPSEPALERLLSSLGRLVDMPIVALFAPVRSKDVQLVAGAGLTEQTRAIVVRLYEGNCADNGTRILTTGDGDSPLRAGIASVIDTPDEPRLGALCFFDTRARAFTPPDLARAAEAARLVAEFLSFRRDALDSKAQLTAVNAASASAIVFTKRDGTVAGCNDATERLLGWTAAELVGEAYSLAPPDAIAQMDQRRQLTLETGVTFRAFEAQRLARDGRLLDVSISAGPVRDGEGNIAGTVVVMDDLTERKRLREVERRLTKVLELTANDAPIGEILENLVRSVEFSIPDGICTILRCRGNALVHAASGAALPEIWVKALDQVRIGPSEGSCGTAAYLGETVIVSDIATDPRWEIPRPLALELDLRSCWSAPIRNARGVVHGTLAVYSSTARVPTDDQLRVMHEAANLASIAIEANQSRERLENLASRDTLTGLPNRAHYQDRLRDAILTAKSEQQRVFVGLLDLDRFKIVNDTLGHMVGDQLLIEVAHRLRSVARQQDTLARMGGDEFLFLLTGIENQHDAESIARRMLAELDRSFSPSGNELFVHASLGFSVYPDDAADPTQLLSLADRAMYDVKARQSRIGFYRPASEQNAIAELPLETALNRALERNEFTLQYQPQVEASNRIRSAQAHVHWHHPNAESLSAERFMAVADEAGLAVSIGTWMLEEACRFAGRWKAAGGAGYVALRISVRHYRDRDFVASVLNAISKAGIVPSQLRLEFSETALAGALDGISGTLAELRSYGIHTMLGDFGANSSNLQHLSRLPIDGVRIDGSLLTNAESVKADAGDRAIFESVVKLSKMLALEVVTDSVETAPQLAQAFASGCDVVQGTVFSRPMFEEQFLAWLPEAALAQTRTFPSSRDTEREAIDHLRAELQQGEGFARAS